VVLTILKSAKGKAAYVGVALRWDGLPRLARETSSPYKFLYGVRWAANGVLIAAYDGHGILNWRIYAGDIDCVSGANGAVPTCRLERHSEN